MTPDLAELILAALAEAAITRRTLAGFCAACQRHGRPCGDHGADHDRAAQYELAYTQVAAGTAAWCDLTTALHAGVN